MTTEAHLDGGLVQVADVGGGLAGFLAHEQELGVDEAEGVNDDLALHGLDRVHHDGNGAVVQRLKTLLRVHINAGQPASESRVGVVPSNHNLWPEKEQEKERKKKKKKKKKEKSSCFPPPNC